MYRFKRSYSILLLLAVVMVFFQSCRKDEIIEEFVPEDPIVEEPDYVPTLPETYYDYESQTYPDYFLADPQLGLFNTLGGSNAITNEGATLGRVLFYDKNLSVNNTISCASCHHQDRAFTDPNQFSEGFEGGLSTRNSMAIFNVQMQRRFFWDIRSNSIEQQVLMPIEHPVEMGMNLDSLIIKIAALPYYQPLFEAAFEDEVITTTRVALALGQFLKAIRSYDSKYDRGVANDFADFNEDELFGKELYFSGVHSCTNCHMTPAFGNVFSHINGLEAEYSDPGQGAVTGDADDYGRFKTVTLRNIELTAPYMHDGRFETLDDVLDFYSTEIQPHPYLDDRLATDFSPGGPPKDLNFTPEERAGYKAFLKTLTDWSMVSNPWYSNPFPE